VLLSDISGAAFQPDRGGFQKRRDIAPALVAGVFFLPVAGGKIFVY
jgi:hypothetical protein